MAKPPKFIPKRNENGHWRLSIPAAFSDTGNRQQLFFKTHKDPKISTDWSQLNEKPRIPYPRILIPVSLIPVS